MKELKLSNSYKVALVDDEDYERLTEFNWRLHSNDYVVYAINSHLIYLHNEVLDTRAGSGIDHINRNKLDNRKCNLRIINHSKNIQNSFRHNPLGFKGVYTEKRTGRYVARIRVNYKRLHLGTFKTPEEAAHEYDKAAIFYFGSDALTNIKLRNYDQPTTERI
jgi:AP2 domain